MRFFRAKNIFICWRWLKFWSRTCIFLRIRIQGAKILLIRIQDAKILLIQRIRIHTLELQIFVYSWRFFPIFKVNFITHKKGCKGRTLNLIKNMEDDFLFLTRICLLLWVSPLLLINMKCASHLCRETANENKQVKEANTWISNSYLIEKKLLRVPMEIGHCHFCMEGRLKLRLQSL